MEKRLILAFLLSFLVLFSWNIIYKPKNTPESSLKKTILVEPVNEKSLPQQDAHLIEDKKVIENEKIELNFSNIGGKLKSIKLKEYNTIFPTMDIFDIPEYSNKDFRLDEFFKNRIVYSLQNEKQTIRKIYILKDNDYIVQSNIEIIPKEPNGLKDELKFKFFDIDYLNSYYKVEDRDKSLLEYIISSATTSYRRSNVFNFSTKDNNILVGPIRSVGFRDRYFALIIKPNFDVDKIFTDSQSGCFLYRGDDLKYIVQSKEYSNPALCDQANNSGKTSNHKYIWNTSLNILFSPKIEKNKDFISMNSLIYFGPQDLERLKNYKEGFDEIMKFSDWGFIDTISKAIYSILHGIHKFIPSWGLCILLISILIYGIMYPLTMKSMSSMKKMQVIQPKIKKLQEQHKGNPEKLNKEMIEIYREHKINPLGGCLPLLLQMPIFIGLYQVLWRSVSFKGASFLWIKDLSEPDRLLVFKTTVPIIGNELNILPILILFIMMLQQKISIKNVVSSDPSQIAQQKMMMIFMPIMIGTIFYRFSSGLCLYFTMFYLFSTMTQWRIYKMNKVSV